EASCAFPSADHGCGDHGIHVLARRAFEAARPQSPAARAESLALSALFPIRPTVANPARTIVATAATPRTRIETRWRSPYPRPARRRAPPHMMAARVTVGISQSQ